MAPQHSTAVKEALELIANSRLAYPLGELLASFMYEAASPDEVARYILQFRDRDLQELVEDWIFIVESFSDNGTPPPQPDAATCAAITRRDGSRCCITGATGSLWDPLVVRPVLSLPTRLIVAEARFVEIMCAFFGISLCGWHAEKARRPWSVSPYSNHWLVRTSAAKAFSEGFLSLKRQPDSMTVFEVEANMMGTLAEPIKLQASLPLLEDHSGCGVEEIDVSFIDTHARLAASIRWIAVSRNLSKNMSTTLTRRLGLPRPVNMWISSTPSRAFRPLDILKTVALSFWRVVPARARLLVYSLLTRLGRRMYPELLSSSVDRLPFGMFLKRGTPTKMRNEFNALQMVRQHTNIPVPRPLDLVCVRKRPVTPDGLPPVSTVHEQFPPSEEDDTHDAYLVASRAPGIPLSRCNGLLSDQDAADFTDQMRDIVDQLRAIPKAVAPGFAICNTVGGPCADPRISAGHPVGPFADETAFNQLLRLPDHPARHGHTSVFTHAGLSPRNILLSPANRPDGTGTWTVTGVVDWEFAGYWPEYWEYTQAMAGSFRWGPRWEKVYRAIFAHLGYAAEFRVEEETWGTKCNV